MVLQKCRFAKRAGVLLGSRWQFGGYCSAMSIRALAPLCLVLVASVASAETPKDVFDKLKSLEGTWSGKAGVGKDLEPTKVIYKVTAGGSAVMETQFPGTAHEMITLYHLDGGDLYLTHYCAAQNQPKMRLFSAKEGKLNFQFVGAGKMNPNAPHMHSLSMTIGNGKVVSDWQMYANGKLSKGQVAHFELTSKK